MVAYNRAITKPSQQKFKHYAIIVQNKTIIALGENYSVKNKTIYKNKSNQQLFSIHAEYAAYRKALKLKHIFNCDEDFELLVIRLNSNLQLCMSKPCIICQNFLRNTNCKRIYYSNEDGKIEQLI